MPIPMILGGIVSMLMDKGLDLAASAIEGGADKAVEFIEDKTGLKLDTNKGLSAKDVQAIKQMEDDPATKIRLQELALERLKEINRHEEAGVKIEHANTADARAMQVAALAQEDKFSKRFVYYFAAAWSLFAMLYIAFITFATIPTPNVRFADTILGFVLGTVIASIINYFVGSTKGSKDKSEAIHTALKKG